jgi:hypothetical protein
VVEGRDLFGPLSFELALSAPVVTVVFHVTVLAQALWIEALVWVAGRRLLPTALVVAILAHALRVEVAIHVRAVSDLVLGAAPVGAFLLLWIIFAVSRLWKPLSDRFDGLLVFTLEQGLLDFRLRHVLLLRLILLKLKFGRADELMVILGVDVHIVRLQQLDDLSTFLGALVRSQSREQSLGVIMMLDSLDIIRSLCLFFFNLFLDALFDLFTEEEHQRVIVSDLAPIGHRTARLGQGDALLRLYVRHTITWAN